MNEDDIEMARETLDEEVKATYLISSANNSRYRELKNSLENDFVKGQDNYPRDCEQALGMLNHCHRPLFYFGR
jgi:hypothetical protein